MARFSSSYSRSEAGLPVVHQSRIRSFRRETRASLCMMKSSESLRDHRKDSLGAPVFAQGREAICMHMQSRSNESLFEPADYPVRNHRTTTGRVARGDLPVRSTHAERFGRQTSRSHRHPKTSKPVESEKRERSSVSRQETPFAVCRLAAVPSLLLSSSRRRPCPRLTPLHRFRPALA